MVEGPRLEDFETVRRRPALYVGGIDDGTAIHRMLFEVVENTVAEHRQGFAKKLTVDIDGDLITVSDDGRGIWPPTLLRGAKFKIVVDDNFGISIAKGPSRRIRAGLLGSSRACLRGATARTDVVCPSGEHVLG